MKQRKKLLSFMVHLLSRCKSSKKKVIKTFIFDIVTTIFGMVVKLNNRLNYLVFILLGFRMKITFFFVTLQTLKTTS